jgi:hypothetical protein
MKTQTKLTARGQKPGEQTKLFIGDWSYPDHNTKKYRHPATGDVFGVDAVLSTAMLNRLNRIPGIEVNGVCAGHGRHGGGYFASAQASLTIRTTKTLGLRLVTAFGKLLISESHINENGTGWIKFPVYGLHQPALFTNGHLWYVEFRCIASEKTFNHRDWWEIVVPWLETTLAGKKSAQRRAA